MIHPDNKIGSVVMIDLKQNKVWFISARRHLHGPQTLETEAAPLRAIAAAFDASKRRRISRVMSGSQFVQELREMLRCNNLYNHLYNER
jgi:hypothetical protein